MSNDPNQNLNKQNPPLQSSPTAPVKETAVDATAAKLDKLLQLMMVKEARLAEAEEATENARKARNAQRELSARTHVNKQMIRQANCRHMKGGKRGPRSGVTDYNVGMHTYINGESVIKCHTCGMKWKQNDTQEHLIRGGKKIANHTKLGWVEAKNMLNHTTNTATSSEVPMDAKPSVEFNGVEI